MKFLDDNGLLYFYQKIKTLLGNKVDKVSGKTLSTNDFTNDYKAKLDGLKNYELPTASTTVKGGAKVGKGLEVDANGFLNATGGGVADAVAWDNVTNKPTTIDGYGITDGLKTTDISDWAKATTKPTYSYTELTNKPTIPSKTSELANDSNYITSSAVDTKINNKLSSVMKYKGTVENYSALPKDALIGDTYNIKTSSENNKAGDNATWNGTTWDILSGTIDLSSYVQTSDLVIISNSEIDTIVAS